LYQGEINSNFSARQEKTSACSQNVTNVTLRNIPNCKHHSLLQIKNNIHKQNERRRIPAKQDDNSLIDIHAGGIKNTAYNVL